MGGSELDPNEGLETRVDVERLEGASARAGLFLPDLPYHPGLQQGAGEAGQARCGQSETVCELGA
jgi:hypothetical protein